MRAAGTPVPLRTRSVVPPTPLRLFYGCLTVFGRRGVGGDTEGAWMGGKEKARRVGGLGLIDGGLCYFFR